MKEICLSTFKYGMASANLKVKARKKYSYK